METSLKPTTDGQNVSSETSGTTLVLEILLGKIRLFADQPRSYFDPEELEGLCESINEIGLRTPILVRPISDGGEYEYELIDGERRYLACQKIGRKTIRAIVETVSSEEEQFLKSTVANFCRSGHTPLETAKALEKIIAYLAQKPENRQANRTELMNQVSHICGRSSTWANQNLGLLKLCPEIQNHLSEKRLPFQVCVSLSSLKPEYQISFSTHIIKHELDFKKALNYIRTHCDQEKLAPGGRKRKPSDDYAALQRFLDYLETKLEEIMDLKSHKIEEIFKGRSNQQFRQIFTQIDNLGNDFKATAQTFKAILEKRTNAKSLALTEVGKN
ncbi:MAG: ParB/RepB/Spo0J family partition protein [Patescibacteria group bacterium]